MARHVLPNISTPVVVLTALSMSTAQLTYSSLAFLGFSWYVRDLSRFSIHGSIAAVIVFLCSERASWVTGA